MDQKRIGASHGVVAPVPVDPTGRAGPTRRAAAGPDWRRSSHGLYVPAHVDLSPAQRVVEVGAHVAGSPVAITGWASLTWRGSRWARGLDRHGSPSPVPLVGGNRAVRPSPTHRLHQEPLPPCDVEVIDGLRVTSAVFAVCFTLRHASSLPAAVESLDMAYADDLVAPDEVLAWLEGHPGRRGIRQAREAWALGDENAWSPQEVRARLLWQEVTGRRPLTNAAVFDLDGRHLATLDRFDPVSGVGGEYDGDHHLDRRQRRKDLARVDDLRAHGVETFTLVSGDLSAGVLLRRIEAAAARAARLDDPARRWTTDPPRWWRSTRTVRERRALAPHLVRAWHPAHIGRRRSA